MNRYLLKIIFIFLLGNCIIIYSQDNATNSIFHINGSIMFRSDEDTYQKFPFYMKGDIGFTFNFLQNFQANFEFEADDEGINTEELSLRWIINDNIRIKAGMFENELSLNDYLSVQNRMFVQSTIVAEYIDELGFITNTPGIKIYKPFRKNTYPFSYLAHFHFIPYNYIPQTDLGFFYDIFRNQTYLGLLGTYRPFLYDDEVFDKALASDFIVNLIFSSYNFKILYSLETSFGTNLDRYSQLLTSSEIGADIFFIGFDSHIGYNFEISSKFSYTPVLRYTLLFRRLSDFSDNKMQVLIGNKFIISDWFYIWLEGGIDIENTDDISIEPIWAFKCRVNFLN
jgi:hypothetical protein